MEKGGIEVKKYGTNGLEMTDSEKLTGILNTLDIIEIYTHEQADHMRSVKNIIILIIIILVIAIIFLGFSSLRI